MAQAIVEKGVGGKFPIGLKYYPPDLAATETISTITTTVSPAGLTLGVPNISVNEVSVEVSVGVAHEEYKVQFKMTTSGGKVFSHPVKDSIIIKVVS